MDTSPSSRRPRRTCPQPAEGACPELVEWGTQQHPTQVLCPLPFHPPPLPVVISQCTLETSYPTSLPRPRLAHPPPPPAHPPHAPAPPPPIPRLAAPVAARPLPVETPPPHPVAPSPRPSGRPFPAPTVVAHPPKKSAQTVSRQPAPSGGRLARDSSPLHPQPNSAAAHPPSAPPYPRPRLAASPSVPPRPRPTAPARPRPPAPHLGPSVAGHGLPRPQFSRKMPPAPPQEFFGKNSYARNATQFRSTDGPSTLAGIHQASEPA